MKRKIFAYTSVIVSVFAIGLASFQMLKDDSNNLLQLRSDNTLVNQVSITRTATWTGNYASSVTAARTEKGNTLEFGATCFDIRNSGDYPCIFFDGGYAKNNGGKSRFWNKTELYGITSIKLYAYNHGSPDSYTSLSSASFTFFYGYELIDFDDANYVAKQTTTSGKIEFAAGYEPSFFGIQGEFTTDTAISKIEITYLCEKVEGELVTNEEAAGYESHHTSFEYVNGNSVVVRELEAAPLAHENAPLDNGTPVYITVDGSSYDASSHSWTTGQGDGGHFVLLGRSDGKSFPARSGRSTIIFTFMISKANGFTGWNGASDVYLYINNDALGARIYTENPYSWAAAVLPTNFEAYETETGIKLASSIWNKKVTVEYDVSSIDSITNVRFGTTHGCVTFKLYDVSFRDSCAEHDYSDSFSGGFASSLKCHKCHKPAFLVNSIQYNNVSGKPSSNFVYEKDVTFDGVDNCIHTTTAVKTNSSEGGWTQNYQVRLNGLIDNARELNRTTIRFKLYITTATSRYWSLRFCFGVATGNSITSFARASHWQLVTEAGNDLAKNMVTSITDENGNPAFSNTANSVCGNKWLVVTLDVSSDSYAGTDLFFSPVVDEEDGSVYPINCYFANLEVLP
ncbi:MAG: hypothetical protein J6M95_03780 [Bacilli bacterium]|nr:hypothetical protein [Bacilli bacterium]